MGITHADKSVSTAKIGCNESFQVKLALSALPDIKAAPKDIALVLDRSGSMNGAPLTELKKGVNCFLDLIEEASDGKKDGIIGNGNRIGIVSFSSTAVIDTPLSTSVSDLKKSVAALRATSSTNHQDAFIKGTELLDNSSSNGKIMIIFTDGQSNSGKEGFVEAEAAKAKGITIYSIGLGDSSRLDIGALHKWASAPSSAYTLIAPTPDEIEDVFISLVQNIEKAGATNIVLTDTLSPCFKVLSVDPPAKGSAVITGDRSVRWNISSLGAAAAEGAELTFTAVVSGSCSGVMPVNASLNYTDNENNIVSFPSPTIEVDCPNPVITEACPQSFDVTIGGCVDSIEYEADAITLDSLGRILQVSTTLKQVCPNKRVSLAVLLYEVDANGLEYARGMKTLLIPAQEGAVCKDIQIRCIKFVLPEALDATGSQDSTCNARQFKVKFIANYADFDYTCCAD